MAVLALRLSYFANGVSRLHGRTARKMWQGLWPELPEQEIPIGHVTNGVHFTTWIGEKMGQLLDFYLGARWRENQDRVEIWGRVEDIPEGELWQAHEKQRERLIKEVRRRLASRLEGRGLRPRR